MKKFSLADVKKMTSRPGFTGTFVHCDSMTLAHWVIEKDAQLAVHAHENEQILFVLEGHLHFDVPTSFEVKPGVAIVFPPNESHGGTAIERTICVDIFSPPREDFKKLMEEQVG